MSIFFSGKTDEIQKLRYRNYDFMKFMIMITIVYINAILNFKLKSLFFFVTLFLQSIKMNLQIYPINILLLCFYILNVSSIPQAYEYNCSLEIGNKPKGEKSFYFFFFNENKQKNFLI